MDSLAKNMFIRSKWTAGTADVKSEGVHEFI